MSNKPELSESISRMIGARPKYFPFPAGGSDEIPLTAETNLMQAFRKWRPTSRADFGGVENSLKMLDAYTLVVFAVRMAVHSVRTKDPLILADCIYALVVDNDLVDWRDMLVALSIIEECARRVGLDGPLVLDKVADLASPERRDLIRKDYLTRTPQMRSGEVMRWSLVAQEGVLTLVRG